MRLIDANSDDIFRVDPDNYPSRMYACGWNGMVHVIEKMPTIDPETLPIVKELMEEVERLKTVSDNWEKQWKGEYEMRKAMKKLKERKPVHAHWGNYSVYTDGYPCSACHLMHRSCTKFCPHCGAKMDEVI